MVAYSVHPRTVAVRRHRKTWSTPIGIRIQARKGTVTKNLFLRPPILRHMTSMVDIRRGKSNGRRYRRSLSNQQIRAHFVWCCARVMASSDVQKADGANWCKDDIMPRTAAGMCGNHHHQPTPARAVPSAASHFPGRNPSTPSFCIICIPPRGPFVRQCAYLQQAYCSLLIQLRKCGDGRSTSRRNQVQTY